MKSEYGAKIIESESQFGSLGWYGQGPGTGVELLPAEAS